MTKPLRKKPEQYIIDLFLIKLDYLFNLAHNSLINGYYFDECGFNRMPNIPYGYQPKGEQWYYPSIRKKARNVAGFLDPFTSHLVTYDLPEKQNMNSEILLNISMIL